MPFGSTAPFDEEKITNYEIGIKSMLFDYRLKLNMSLFYYDFTDLQFLLNQEATVKATNAGSADGSGLELELQYLLTENLTLSMNTTLLDASYGEDVIDANGDKIVFDGQELAYSPNLSANLSLDYYLTLGEMGELRTHINFSYTDEQYHSGSSNDAVYLEDAKTLINARVTYISPNQEWQIAAWTTNSSNEDSIESIGGVTDDFGVIPARRGEPRMIGVEFSYYY